jgi:hypothetical protein
MERRERHAPIDPDRHDKFQFGTNPMEMTEFERSRVALEIAERKTAKIKYTLGIQGVDGGPLVRDRIYE